MTPKQRDRQSLEDVVIAFKAQGTATSVVLPGASYSEFQIPFSREEVERGLADFSPQRVAVDPLTLFGSTLFNALFAGERGRALWDRVDRATRDDRAFRLRIHTNLERTQHLPWELIFDGSRQDFVSLSGRVALVRTRPDGYKPDAPMAPRPSLRVLAASASPVGSDGANDDLAALQALADRNADRLQLTSLRSATRGAIDQALAGAKFDLFVFFGDGQVMEEVSKAGGIRQALAAMPEPANPDGLIARNRLGEALWRAGVRLAVVDGSHSDWIARSFAKHIPSAIGFREQVTRATRSLAVPALLGALLQGEPLDLAVTTVRQALDRAAPGTGQWCRLIFYLQMPDGGFLLAPAGDPAAVAEPALPQPPAAVTNREAAKWMRLREVYRMNLASAERTQAAPDASRPLRIQALRDKIDALEAKIDAALRSTGGAP
jgi:hypothetical protein